MKYIKTYELKQTFFVSIVKKDDIDKLKYIIDELTKKKISFKVHDSGNMNKKYYYIITKKQFFIDGNAHYNDNNLQDYGDKIDYEPIIATLKYNL